MKINNDILEKVFNLDKYAVLVKNGEVFGAQGVEKHETQKSFIWIINPNELKFDPNILENLDNIRNHVFKIKGMWACIIKDKNTNNIKAISSIHNEYPWYFAKKSADCISNNIFLLSNVTGLKEIDFASIASFLAINCSVAGFTFIEDIKKNFGGDIIISDGKTLLIKETNLKEWLGFDNSIKDKELLLERFLEAINESVDSNNTQITLTAGRDSRAVLAGIIHTKKPFKIMTGAASTVAQRDIIIPEKISKILGIEHIKVDASKKNGYPLQTMLDEVALITNVEFIPTNMILYHKEFIQGKDELKGVTRLLGYGGEIFKPRPDVTVTYPQKLSFIKSIFGDIVMDRVNFLFNEYKNIADVNSKALYHLRGKFQFWEAVNTRTYSRYCHIYNPLSDPELYSLAFRYFGSVENINFHNLVYTLLPDKVKKVPINLPKSLGLLNKFKRRYLRAKTNYDYYLTPDFLKNEIDFELLDQILPAQNIKKMIETYRERGLYAGLLHKIYALGIFRRIIY